MTFVIGLIILALATWIMYAGAGIEKEQYVKYLDFIIVGQTIQRAPECDFSGLVAGSRGYLRARFRFSGDWVGCRKVVIFSAKGKDYPAALINNTCEIPAEALTCELVKVRAVGRRDGFEISTGTVAFSQRPSR